MKHLKTFESLYESPLVIELKDRHKRIIWVDDNFNSSTRGEFDILHRKTQQELREIYR